MSDGFLSYARKDGERVQTLRTALEARNLDVWVDLDGIHAGETFWPVICAAIDAADAFVAVVTPAAARSPHCRRELEHALARGKPVVPVVLEPVQDADLHPELASRQWVFLRRDDDFAEGVGRLVRAVGAEPDWRRAHSRWLARAGEWLESGRDGARSLRGAELRAAERWLAEEPPDDEQPSSLHRRYIRASRVAASRRRRLVNGAAAIALIVTATLGLSAGIERHQAAVQAAQARDRAIELATEAGSTALALRDFRQASQHLKRARLLCATTDSTSERCAAVDLELGRVLRDAGDFGAAMERYSRALDVVEAPGFVAGDDAREIQAIAYEEMAHARTRLAESAPDAGARGEALDRAERDLEWGRAIRETYFAGDPRREARWYDVRRGRIRLARGEYSEAIALLEDAARRYEHQNPQSDIHLLAAAARWCAGDTGEATRWAQRYVGQFTALSADPVCREGLAYYREVTSRCSQQG